MYVCDSLVLGRLSIELVAWNHESPGESQTLSECAFYSNSCNAFIHLFENRSVGI